MDRPARFTTASLSGHQWVDNRPNTPEGLMMPPRRRCARCGVTQELHEETTWDRTISRRWLPVVGRCTGKKEEVA